MLPDGSVVSLELNMPLTLSAVFLAILQAVGAIGAGPSQPPKKNTFVPSFVAMAKPPSLPKVDFNACPFEGCQFGEWTASKPVEVFSTWKAERKPLFILPPGEKVTAATGVNVVLTAGKGIFDRDVPEYGAKVGDILYSYGSCGEGEVDMWTHGRFIKCSDPGFSWKDEGCRTNCNGHYIALGKNEWWVKIRVKDGRIGWVRVTDNFDGTDALA